MLGASVPVERDTRAGVATVLLAGTANVEVAVDEAVDTGRVTPGTVVADPPTSHEATEVIEAVTAGPATASSADTNDDLGTAGSATGKDTGTKAASKAGAGETATMSRLMVAAGGASN